VHIVLSDRRMVLKLAFLSLIESMKNDFDKYSHLIYNNNMSSIPVCIKIDLLATDSVIQAIVCATHK
jgi:hypothetical protein